MPHQSKIARLRPRDLEIVRGLIAWPALKEERIAKRIEMSVNNLKGRLKRVYDVLDVSTRVQLYAEYHRYFVPCVCPHCGPPEKHPDGGTPTGESSS